MLTKVASGTQADFKRSQRILELIRGKKEPTVKDTLILKAHTLCESIPAESLQFNLLQGQLGLLIAYLNHPRSISGRRARHLETVGQQNIWKQIAELHRFLGSKKDLWDFALQTLNQIERQALSQETAKTLRDYGIRLSYEDGLYFYIPTQRHRGSTGETWTQTSESKVHLDDVSRQMIHISISLYENPEKHRKSIKAINRLHDSVKILAEERMAFKKKKGKTPALPQNKIKSIKRGLDQILKAHQKARDPRLNKNQGTLPFSKQAPVKTDINPVQQQLQNARTRIERGQFRKAQQYLSQAVAALESRISAQNQIFQFQLRKANTVHRAAHGIRKILSDLKALLASDQEQLQAQNFENQKPKFYYTFSRKLEAAKDRALREMESLGLGVNEVRTLFEFLTPLYYLVGFQSFAGTVHKIKNQIQEFPLKNSRLYQQHFTPILANTFEFNIASIKDSLKAIGTALREYNLTPPSTRLLKDIAEDLGKLLESRTLANPHLNFNFTLDKLLTLAQQTHVQLIHQINGRWNPSKKLQQQPLDND